MTRRQWTAKSTAYRSLNLSFAAPSRWIAGVARQSSLGKEYPIHHLPSGVDTEVFHPGDRIRARRSLGLPEDGPMLMFGAVNSLGSPRKGYAELSEALHILAARPAHNRLRLAIFGNERPVAEGTFSFPVHDLGSVATDADLARLYPAADVLVAPSIEENLPNVVMEAMACGVPCAAFDVGGMSDLIRDGLTGALARTTDAPTLANAISRLLETASPSLAESSRQHIVKQYDLRRQAAAYRKVLEDLARLAARRVIALSQPLRR